MRLLPHIHKSDEHKKCGKKLCFHGSFDDKRKAVSREKETPNSFIIERGGRYIVATEKEK